MHVPSPQSQWLTINPAGLLTYIYFTVASKTVQRQDLQPYNLMMASPTISDLFVCVLLGVGSLFKIEEILPRHGSPVPKLIDEALSPCLNPLPAAGRSLRILRTSPRTRPGVTVPGRPHQGILMAPSG
ncbi:hypothetical protein GGS20DRAFT_275095 [Poronia punctata]|nr:hypothetical protein GGS20DRAFT_275095 [Poronia punctata]